MTPDTFRRLARTMPEAIEVGHMGHPDFRVGGKIFATLGYPEDGWAMVKSTPEQQEAFVATEPAGGPAKLTRGPSPSRKDPGAKGSRVEGILAQRTTGCASIGYVGTSGPSAPAGPGGVPCASISRSSRFPEAP